MDGSDESLEEYIERSIIEWLRQHDDCGGQPFMVGSVLDCTCRGPIVNQFYTDWREDPDVITLRGSDSRVERPQAPEDSARA